ncbi:hypothetical protein [Embleya sp. AB8]|uniref:hypothetical protein n=1 Tax=Embleya sp. AB8 TaxID=3156304 RepID=UPI003C7368BD
MKTKTKAKTKTKMRRVAGAAVSVLAAGALVVSSPASAWAASGTLTVSGRTYENPAKGCYTGKYWPLAVNNDTDTVVYVFDDAECHGARIGVIAPGSSIVNEFGGSVEVPR